MPNKNKTNKKQDQQNILYPPEEYEYDEEESVFARFLHSISPSQIIAFLLILVMLVLAVILGVHAVRAKNTSTVSEIKQTSPVETALPSDALEDNNAVVSPSPEVTSELTVTPSPVPAITAAPATSTTTQSTSTSSGSTSYQSSPVSAASYCTVTFDSDGGSEVASVRVKVGDRVAEPATPIREGYRFTGWYVNARCTAAYYFDRETVRKDITLFAGWEDLTVSETPNVVIVTPEPTVAPTTVPATEEVTVTELYPDPNTLPENTGEPTQNADAAAGYDDQTMDETQAEDVGEEEQPSDETMPEETGDEYNYGEETADETMPNTDETLVEETASNPITLVVSSAAAAQPEGGRTENLADSSAISFSVPDGVPAMEGLPDDLSAAPFALINANGAFFAVCDDQTRLCLSGTPVFWSLAGDSSWFSMRLSAESSATVGATVDEIQTGTAVTLNTNNDGYNSWCLSPYGDGYLLLCSNAPEYCLLAGEKGFWLGRTDLATANDVWRLVECGDWSSTYVSPLQAPYYVSSVSQRAAQVISSSDEAWQDLYTNGVSSDAVVNLAPDVTMQPMLAGISGKSDAFTIDFYSGSQPDSTDWTLVSWTMDTTEFMDRNGYTDAYTSEATVGLRVLQDGSCAFMNMPSITFTADGQEDLTLTPNCTYTIGGDGDVLGYNWQADTWYRIVLRSWTHTETETTYVGYWIENLYTGEVTLLAVYDTHLPQSCLTGSLSQHLQSTDGLSGSAYTELQVSNLRVRDAETQEWTSLDHVVMKLDHAEEAYYTLWRFSAADGVFRAEVSGTEAWSLTYVDGEALLSARPAAGEPDLSPFTALGMQGYND